MHGFTLVEILVAVALILILISVVAMNYTQAGERARIARAETQLLDIRNGIALMAKDTGLYPRGCPPRGTSNPELDLDSGWSGLLTRPGVGAGASGDCNWTAEAVNRWNGPYVETVIDPWGNAYHYDPDYFPYSAAGCAKPDEPGGQYIVSFGPNGSGINTYDCDDIFIRLQ